MIILNRYENFEALQPTIAVVKDGTEKTVAAEAQAEEREEHEDDEGNGSDESDEGDEGDIEENKNNLKKKTRRI